MKESDWSEAEKACVALMKMHNESRCDATSQAIEIGKKLIAGLEPDVKPVFPDEECFLLSNIGASYDHYNRTQAHLISAAKQGNTFETRLLAEEESTRREAETRVREKINIANKGSNMFANGWSNYYLSISNIGEITYTLTNKIQAGFTWEYIRDKEEGNKLLEDEEFVADWKLMKGVEL